MALARLRKEYRGLALRESLSPSEPLALFARWMKAALAADLREPTAMALASVDAKSRPSNRMVLLKGVDRGFVFYTNTGSRKGSELAEAPSASLLLWWDALHRQVRIEGRVSPVANDEADEYFRSRPRGAQISAWASPQSRRIASREVLEARVERLTARFLGRPVPRPHNWGGFRLIPARIEFWQGRRDRLHDRLLYTRTRSGWTRNRLAP